jgi:predicted methyltransferase
MRGEWERKGNTLWTYRIAGATRPYGYVVQYRDTGRSDADWDATVTAGRLDDEQIVAERVSFDEARTALEQYAQHHADRIFE